MSEPESVRTRALRARLVLPVSGEPLRDGVVTIVGDRIVSVQKYASGQAVEDLGNVAILPGLINAHTHLEFSSLESQLAAPGTPLPQWIAQVIEYRRTRSDPVAAGIARGLRESSAAGVTALGEIATSVWPDDVAPAEPENCPAVTLFLELIALSVAHVPERLAAAERFLSTSRKFVPGLSPHAPYTVHPELLAGCVKLSQRFRAPLAMHLAESREELELLQSSSGGFRELFESLGFWSADAIPAGSRVHDYLRVLSKAQRALVIHGNYLDREEIAFLADHAERLSVVYCPRTHDFFRHSAYPLAEMLARGVAMALGTDSRASNPDLNMFEEMRFVTRRHPGVPAKQVLELGTLGGARALGIDGVCGSLTPGKRADLAVIALSEINAAKPYECLFGEEAHVVETWLGGRRVVAAR